MLVLEGPARALGEAGSLEDPYEGIEEEDEVKDNEKGDNEEKDDDKEKKAEQENLSFLPLPPLEHFSDFFSLRSFFSSWYSIPSEPSFFAHQPSLFVHQPSLFIHQPSSSLYQLSVTILEIVAIFLMLFWVCYGLNCFT